MAAIYDLIADYGSPDACLSMAPVIVLAVVGWEHPFVFDRATRRSSNLDAFAERSASPLIIASDCASIQVTAPKQGHTWNLTAQLRDGNINYLSAIFPDDWLLAWILPNESRGRELVQALRDHEPCNSFRSGLKFVGRVQSVFSDRSIADGGAVRSAFTLTGVGFSEFDYPLFWEPLLATNDALPSWYQRFGIAFNDIVTGKDRSVTRAHDPHSIDVNKMIPALVRLTLGEGPFQSGNVALPGGANASPNGGIRVPSVVGKLLGMVDTAALNYSDLLDVHVGVQKFSGEGVRNMPDIFVPEGLKDASITSEHVVSSPNSVETKPHQNESATVAVAEYQETGIPLLGEFPLVSLPIQDTPIWSILTQFLNPAVNDMYVALRPDESGDIYPRLTVRQLPFSSQKFANSNRHDNQSNRRPAPFATNLGNALTQQAPELNVANDLVPVVTTLLELPRWRIDPKMLRRIQVGRSNALRFNFWHIQGTGSGMAISPQLQYVLSPPLTDKSDIERSGLRSCTRKVNCLIKDAVNPRKWRDIVTDITAGMHLALSGTIETYGIVAPIAPGDNCQFGNVVYHIENVAHVCDLSDQGKRTWRTILQVSHGMADEVLLDANQNDSSLDPQLQEYAGVRNSDPTTVQVGKTVEDHSG